MNSLVDAESIVNKSIALFKIRGFDLVKGCVNREAFSVFANINVDSLASGFRELDREGDCLKNLFGAKVLDCIWETSINHLRIAVFG